MLRRNCEPTPARHHLLCHSKAEFAIQSNRHFGWAISHTARGMPQNIVLIRKNRTLSTQVEDREYRFQSLGKAKRS